MRHIKSTLLVVLLFIGSMAPTYAGVDTNITFPLNLTIQKANCPEAPTDIYLTGIVHLVSSVTIDSAGNLHLRSHINFQGKGVDSNGGEYTFADQDAFSFNGSAPNTPPFELSMLEQVHMLSRGGAQNIIFKATLHITVRADGTTTAYVDNVRGDEGCVPENNLP